MLGYTNKFDLTWRCTKSSNSSYVPMTQSSGFISETVEYKFLFLTHTYKNMFTHNVQHTCAPQSFYYRAVLGHPVLKKMLTSNSI